MVNLRELDSIQMYKRWMIKEYSTGLTHKTWGQIFS